MYRSNNKNLRLNKIQDFTRCVIDIKRSIDAKGLKSGKLVRRKKSFSILSYDILKCDYQIELYTALMPKHSFLPTHTYFEPQMA